jgi:hypothetical protein
MARKKEVIQKEWDTAQTALTNALNKADKAVDDLTLTDKDVADAQAKYDDWKKLLNESVTKIAAWKNEKDKERLAWMKYVETQKTKSDRNYITRIQNLWSEAATVLSKVGGKKALEELVLQYEHDCLSKLKKVNETVKETETAIEKKDAVGALKKHGVALNYLKGVTPYATKSGLKKSAENYAKTNKTTVKDMDLADKKLKEWFDKTVAVYGKLTEKLEELEPQIGELAEELANKEPESENKDPLYNTHLKEIHGDYKDVLAFASAGLNKTKKLQGDVKKLTAIVPRATAEVADKMADTAVKLFQAMQTEYGAVDSHIQKTIRTDSSTVTVKRKAYNISTEDQLKTLGPLMDRAFALNFQAKAAFENSIDELRDVLESLVSQFDNAKAKGALSTVTM